MTKLLLALLAATVGAMLGSADVRAAELPAATVKILTQLKLEAAILDGLDEELKMKPEWIEGAKKEPAALILATWNPQEWRQLSEPLRARFPDAKFDYVRSSRDNRQAQMLVAYKQGRFVADVISSFSSVYQELLDLNGLVDLRELPNFTRVADGLSDPKGWWVGERISYWCMAYNTDMVKKQELPVHWEDLLANPFWKNGRLALTNAPAGWLPVIWQVHGEAWTLNFMKRLFVELKPQRRHEGRDATAQLTAAGEQAASLPSGDYRVKQFADRGAPVDFHCPSIVPSSPAQLGILRGSPAPNNSKIFLNWFLSKEGQLAMFNAVGEVPVHKDFQIRRFVPYPDQVYAAGKKIVHDDLNARELDKIQQVWTQAWNNELPGQK